MEAHEYDKKSWHYRLASVYGSRSIFDDDESDICLYIRQIIYGVMMACLFTTLGVLFGTMPVNFVIWSIVSLKTDTYINMDPAAFAFVLLFGITVISACFYPIIKLLLKFFDRPDNIESPPFIIAAYRSMKDKYCFKISFK